MFGGWKRAVVAGVKAGELDGGGGGCEGAGSGVGEMMDVKGALRDPGLWLPSEPTVPSVQLDSEEPPAPPDPRQGP